MTVPDDVDAPVDVLFDGQRVWSFNPAREALHSTTPGYVRWPRVLRRHLEGVTLVELRRHGDAEAWYADEVSFGSSHERLRLVDAEGNPLAVDKGGRLQRTFSDTGDDARAEIVDATLRVLADLEEHCGLDAYLAYGCLLGAVRDGHMIGHDSDSDVAYLSEYTHPLDIIRECQEAIRTMRSRGWQVVKMSGANFKVWLPLPDGRRCGIDVFGSFHIGENFHLTGSLRGKLDRSVVLPLSTVELEGRQVPAPRDPETFLAFTYGPRWRVPDPAFHFDHPPANVHRMDTLLRASRRRSRWWSDFYRAPESAKVPTEHSAFAAWTQERLPAGRAHVVDLGCGNGRDAVWFAEQGHRVTAADFAMSARTLTSELAAKLDVKVTMLPLNLEDLRLTLMTGARFAYQKGERQVYARGLLDTLGPNGRAGLWRFSSMLLREGGQLYVEFRTPRSADERKFFGKHLRTFVEPADAVREIEAAGGRVVEQVVGRNLARLGHENPEMCRLVVRWSHA